MELDLIREEARDFAMTDQGAKWFTDFGINLDAIRRGRRNFARQCLDWSERRHHVAGALGAALTSRLFEMRWIERIPSSRAVRVTHEGFKGLEDELDIKFER